jgi:hypothetical protein
MRRFTLITLALLAAAVSAPAGPKPPAIGVCYGQICLTELRWQQASMFGSPLPSVTGVLINNSPATLSFVNLQLDLKSGALLGNTAPAIFNGQIPPGGQWAFSAIFMSFDGQRIVTRIDSGVLQYTAIQDGASKRIAQQVEFEPLFHPSNRKERKEWEKLHGPRQR